MPTLVAYLKHEYCRIVWWCPAGSSRACSHRFSENYSYQYLHPRRLCSLSRHLLFSFTAKSAKNRAIRWLAHCFLPLKTSPSQGEVPQCVRLPPKYSKCAKLMFYLTFSAVCCWWLFRLRRRFYRHFRPQNQSSISTLSLSRPILGCW